MQYFDSGRRIRDINGRKKSNRLRFADELVLTPLRIIQESYLYVKGEVLDGEDEVFEDLNIMITRGARGPLNTKMHGR